MPKHILLSSFRQHRGNLGNRVISGAKWTFAGTGLRVVATVLSTSVLARLLSPADFGVIAMASLITEITALLSEVGISSILIQKARLRRTDLDTAFWLSLGVGTLLALGVSGLSFFANEFFNTPLVQPVLLGMSLTFILDGLSIVPSSLLRRTLNFREDFAVETTVLLTRVLTSIGLAALGWGVWSLVIGSLAGRSLGTALAWILVPYPPRPRFDKALVKSQWKIGTSYLGSGLLNHFMANMDYWVVGRKFGAESLGFYQVAFSIPQELRNRIAGPLQRVLFPAYSKMQNDPAAFRWGVMKSTRLLLILVAPLGTGIAVMAPDLVFVLYGEKWNAVAPLLSILAIGGVGRALISLINSIFFSKGRPDYVFRITLFSAPLVIAVILISSYWGLMGVAWAMLIVQIPNFMTAYLALRLVGLETLAFYRQFIPIITACAVMAIAIHFLFEIEFIAHLHPALRLFSLPIFGAAVYALALFISSRTIFDEARTLAMRFISFKS